MRKYLLHILIISFIFLLAPTAHVATYAGKIEDAKENVRKYPDEVEAHFGLGCAYGDAANWKEAIESYKQAIRIDPDYKSAHYNLGITYLQINDRGSALEQYKILKKLDTELANGLFDLINK